MAKNLCDRNCYAVKTLPKAQLQSNKKGLVTISNKILN